MVVIALLLVAMIVQLLAHRVETLSRTGQQAWETFAQRILEGFRGMRTIRAFGHESYEQKRFVKDSQRTSHLYFKLELLSCLVAPVSEVLMATVLIAVIVIQLPMVERLPAVLTFIFILCRLQPYIQQLDKARIRLIAAIAPVETVMNFLDHSDKPYVRSGSLTFPGLREAITFQSVSFCYDPAAPLALRDVSIRIPKGKTIALVGPSGAGKSTLMHLLLRFYDPTQGTIYVDDVPLQQFDFASWRRRIAVVSQDIHLFNTTIRQNIAYGRLDAPEEDIIAAARQAEAHDFICALPQAYETKIGDQGVLLSGGQKQRLALARAIVRNPEILVLDEATNALDSIAEHLIQQALDAMSHERTVIIIAHRLSTIERADHIIVLEKGSVREQGNLQYLLKRGSLFPRFYNLQYCRAISECFSKSPMI
jgi:subfamily B ATP-binding cassette protein MsbA